MPTKIEWTDETWNVITGCGKLCRDQENRIYCYAYKMAQRLKGRYGYNKQDPFKPTLHGNRLFLPLKWKKPRRIFVNSMGDWWDKDVPQAWRNKAYSIMNRAKQHTFQILTKQPQNIHEVMLPKNCWVGVTVDGLYNQSDLIETLYVRSPAKINFVSFEPLLGRPDDLDYYLESCHIDWAIIGALSGLHGFQPRSEWINEILLACSDLGIPVYIKDNVEWIGTSERPRDFPIKTYRS